MGRGGLRKSQTSMWSGPWCAGADAAGDRRGLHEVLRTAPACVGCVTSAASDPARSSCCLRGREDGA